MSTTRNCPHCQMENESDAPVPLPVPSQAQIISNQDHRDRIIELENIIMHQKVVIDDLRTQIP